MWPRLPAHARCRITRMVVRLAEGAVDGEGHGVGEGNGVGDGDGDGGSDHLLYFF